MLLLPEFNFDLLSWGCGAPDAFSECPHISLYVWGDLRVSWGVEREELALV